jgi:predicted lipoprotein with Yx(FWY)xxD motif
MPVRWGRSTLAAVVIGLVSTTGGASESIPKALNTQAPYPAAVSLLHESGGWTYRQSGTSAPLYFNEKDSPDKSACDSACETQWYPLLAEPAEKSVGEWTAFKRRDGRRQWAFKKRPVYTHIHDSADHPMGDGMDGVWHLMPHFMK